MKMRPYMSTLSRWGAVPDAPPVRGPHAATGACRCGRRPLPVEPVRPRPMATPPGFAVRQGRLAMGQSLEMHSADHASFPQDQQLLGHCSVL